MAKKYLDYDGLSYYTLALRSDSTPPMDGTAAVGTSKKFARQDHVHPSDTTKVDKVSGKGLSTNDYTTNEKNKLAGIEAGAEVNTIESISVNGTPITPDASGNVAITVASTDTKNTAGATDSSSKLYLIGATSQAANPQTYSHDTAYVDTNGHLYSNSKQVVNLSDSQALTNKTYNGYTLAAACAKGVDTSIASGSTSTNVPTSAAVAAAISAAQVGAATFQGTVNAPADISGLTAYKKGYYWVVATAGTYAGNVCEVGDMIFAIADRGSSTQNSDFSVVQSNLDLAAITNAEIDTIMAS